MSSVELQGEEVEIGHVVEVVMSDGSSEVFHSLV